VRITAGFGGLKRCIELFVRDRDSQCGPSSADFGRALISRIRRTLDSEYAPKRTARSSAAMKSGRR